MSQCKLSASQIHSICILHELNVKTSVIASMYNVTRGAIWWHITGRSKAIDSNPIETARILRETADKLERQHGPET